MEQLIAEHAVLVKWLLGILCSIGLFYWKRSEKQSIELIASKLGTISDGLLTLARQNEKFEYRQDKLERDVAHLFATCLERGRHCPALHMSATALIPNYSPLPREIEDGNSEQHNHSD